MTVIDLPRTQSEQTPESLRLAQIEADIAAIDKKLNDPQGWAKVLEDERCRLLSERADLLRDHRGLIAATFVIDLAA